jgi:hypothetical protein
MARIERLPSDPFPVQLTKLQGAERLYRLRVGDYWIVYEMDPGARHILVQYVRHRRDAYRQLSLSSASLTPHPHAKFLPTQISTTKYFPLAP